jgi:hypothetical protein
VHQDFTELWANKNADNSKNGMVGNKGKKIPKMPKSSDIIL